MTVVLDSAISFRHYLRRSIPGPWNGDRRFRPQIVVFFLQWHGPRIHGDRPGGAAHLGGSHCVSDTGRASAAQKLKYHIQTSGRSLHAKAIDLMKSAPPCRH